MRNIVRGWIAGVTPALEPKAGSNPQRTKPSALPCPAPSRRANPLAPNKLQPKTEEESSYNLEEGYQNLFS